VHSTQVHDLLRDSGALLTGHFLLSSGLHSDTYVQSTKFLQHPAQAEELARAIAEPFGDSGVAVVCSPAIGGVVIGHEVARQLGARAIFSERKGGLMMLRRGFDVAGGEKVLVVEDIVTTGESVKDIIEIVRSLGGDVVSAACIVDRGDRKDLGAPLHALAEMSPPTWDPDRCPLCEAGTAAIKPGGAPRKGP
jgi:orotate phosphoribosyltransferase